MALCELINTHLHVMRFRASRFVIFQYVVGVRGSYINVHTHLQAIHSVRFQTICMLCVDRGDRMLMMMYYYYYRVYDMRASACLYAIIVPSMYRTIRKHLCSPRPNT